MKGDFILNGKKILIITCIYNQLPLIAECIQAVQENTTGDYEHVLVYNHPPYPEVKEYINKSGATVLDPLKNLGCHRGFNFAFDFKGDQGFDYIVKLDDDTIVPKNWNEPMIEVLEQDDRLAYISSINKNARQGNNFAKRKVGKYTIEIPRVGVVGFSCVMFPIKILNEIGVMSKINTLYGGEELDFLERVRDAGKYGGYIKEVVACHLGNESREIDYVLWKYVYGYLGFTNKDFITFKADRMELIKYYNMWIDTDNEVFQNMAKQRLYEIYNN